MNTGALDTHTGAYRVDAVVIRLHGNLGTLTGDTDNIADSDKSVVNLRHLGLEQTLQEDGRSAGQHNDWIVVAHLHLQHHSTHRIALAETVGRYLLGLGEHQFYLLLVENQNFLVPGLIDLAYHYLTHFLFVLLEDQRLLVVLNLAYEVLTDGQNLAATEIRHIDGFRELFAHLKVGFNLDGIAVGDFQILILHSAVFNDGAVAENLQVTLVNIHNDIEVVLGAIAFGQGGTENLLKDVHQCLAVYVFKLFKFLKRIYQI